MNSNDYQIIESCFYVEWNDDLNQSQILLVINIMTDSQITNSVM